MSTQSEDQAGGRDSEAWRSRVAADLQAYRAEQQWLWGGIDEMTLARYEAGVSPDDERALVEQAMRDHPALRESMETARELSAHWQATSVPPATLQEEAELQASEHEPKPAIRLKRRIRGMLIGIAAVLLFGVLGLLLRQQSSIAELKHALEDMERKNIHLQATLGEAARTQAKPVDTPREVVKTEQSSEWPPSMMLLAGTGERRSRPYNFVIWLQKSQSDRYIGVMLPTDQRGFVRLTRVNGVFDKETSKFSITVTPTQPRMFTTIPIFSSPTDGQLASTEPEPEIGPLVVKLDRDTGNFEGSYFGTQLMGYMVNYKNNLTKEFPPERPEP